MRRAAAGRSRSRVIFAGKAPRSSPVCRTCIGRSPDHPSLGRKSAANCVSHGRPVAVSNRRCPTPGSATSVFGDPADFGAELRTRGDVDFHLTGRGRFMVRLTRFKWDEGRTCFECHAGYWREDESARLNRHPSATRSAVTRSRTGPTDRCQNSRPIQGDQSRAVIESSWSRFGCFRGGSFLPRLSCRLPRHRTPRVDQDHSGA